MQNWSYQDVLLGLFWPGFFVCVWGTAEFIYIFFGQKGAPRVGEGGGGMYVCEFL